MNCCTRMNNQRWIGILWWRERGLEFWLWWFQDFFSSNTWVLPTPQRLKELSHRRTWILVSPTQLLRHYFMGYYAGRTALRKNVNILAMFVRFVRPGEKMFPPLQELVVLWCGLRSRAEALIFQLTSLDIKYSFMKLESMYFFPVI